MPCTGSNELRDEASSEARDGADDADDVKGFGPGNTEDNGNDGRAKDDAYEGLG